MLAMSKFKKAFLGAIGSALAITAIVVAVPSASAAPVATVTTPQVEIAAQQGAYTPLTPFRVLDTRNGRGVTGHSPLGTGDVLKVQITGVDNIPDNASSVALNVTEADNTGGGGYLTVYPDGATRPTASNVNFPSGDTRPNFDIAKLGTDGAIDIYNLNGKTDVVVDIQGFFAPLPTPAPTTFGVGQVFVHTSTSSPDPSLWAQYTTPELGAPGGDQANGEFRFTCKLVNGCDVSAKAYSTADGWTVYPRLNLQKDGADGTEKYCEYADGVNNQVGTETGFSGVLATSATAPTALTLGVGGSFDCGSTTQTGTPGDSVVSFNVPGATDGIGIHYNVDVDDTFVRTAG